MFKEKRPYILEIDIEIFMSEIISGICLKIIWEGKSRWGIIKTKLAVSW